MFRNSIYSALVCACGVVAGAHASSAQTFKTIYSFTGGCDGANPLSTPFLNGGDLYGTTENGGIKTINPNGYGTVFKLDPATGAETTLHDFGGGTDGQYPSAGLTYQAGLLYGTTFGGGSAGNGTVFSINPLTGAKLIVHSFAGGADGESSFAKLIYQSGYLYGTTSGGSSSSGTIFKINIATGVESVVYGFKGGIDAAAPQDDIVYNTGNLYGTATSGGAAGFGAVYKVNATTGAETILHSFSRLLKKAIIVSFSGGIVANFAAL